MGYRLDSKALGKELSEKETLSYAGVPQEDRLMISADITAGGTPIDQSPRMRRLRADYNLIQELNTRSDLIHVEPVAAHPGIPPDRYIVTFLCKSIIGWTGQVIQNMGKNTRWKSTCTTSTRSAGRV